MTETIREYDSLEAFIAASESPDGVHRTVDRASRRSGVRDSWYQTNSYEAAVKLARTGWTEGRARIETLAETLRESVEGSSMGSLNRWRQRTSVTGSRPHVPNAIAGKPNSMIRYERKAVDSPIVSIVFNASVSSGVSTDIIERKGAAVAALVDLLESTGRRCEVILISRWTENPSGQRSGDIVEYRITLKRASDALQIDSLAFTLAHPSMVRRLVFGLQEHEPNYRKFPNYGYPSDSELTGDVTIGRSYLGEVSEDWIKAQLKANGVDLG